MRTTELKRWHVQRGPERMRCKLCRRDHQLPSMYANGISAEQLVPNTFCNTCAQLTQGYLSGGRAVAQQHLATGAKRLAYAKVLELGQELEEQINPAPRVGRPPAIAQDFALNVTSLRGVSDGELALILGKSPQYVKNRRKRSVFRTPVSARQYEPAA